MERGLVHLYCGDGKGKTSCAMGLALRAAGRGMRVVVAQFLKGADSGERRSLARLPGVTLLEVPEQVKFSFAMNEAERLEASGRFQALLEQVEELARSGACELAVLDEVCAAVNTGMLPLERVVDFLDHRPQGVEVVLTGRDPARELAERADYWTEMVLRKHPYQQGIAARPGIEY